MANKPKIFEELERMALVVPAPFYWADKDCIISGVNMPCFGLVDKVDEKKLIGKTAYDLYTPETALIVEENSKKVMQERKAITFEEMMIDRVTGKKRFSIVTRSPLFENGEVVGVVGVITDITSEKEAERLTLETELQKAKLREQENFKKIVDQMASDTQSPSAILLILVEHCMGLPKEKLFATLKSYADLTATSVVWLDTNNVYMGINKRAYTDTGGSSAEEFIGKTIYDIFPFEIADHFVQHNNKVMQIRKILTQEGAIKNITTGALQYYNVFKSPLIDNTGKVVGIVWVSVDITSEKEASQLKLENELQKTRLVEQENFRKVATQVVHDIRSPLASLLMILKAGEEDIPEKMRVALREAATGINDIANNLLCRYENDDSKAPLTEERQPILVSLILLQLLSQKRQQYKELPIKFTHDFCPGCNFVFVETEFTSFKRMMSNLINNAVDALEEREGKINVRLSLDSDQVIIAIQDTGKGMPQEVIDKIMGNIAVTANKKFGHGIGFVQIRETLQRNQGKLEIKSKINKGTEIILTFPIISPPDWIAKEIKLNVGDTVVILDDDSSILHAWESRFKKYGKDINLKYFTLGEEAIDFINAFPKKNQIFLLADFELLKQELNGLHAIERTNIKRSILVTSHYANKVVLDLAAKSGTKILPKPLASEVPIEINYNVEDGESEDRQDEGVITKRISEAGGLVTKDTAAASGGDKKNSKQHVIKGSKGNKSNKCGKYNGKGAVKLKKPDLILIDDEQMFVDALTNFFVSQGKVIAKYTNPVQFLEKISQYAKDTKICMDHDFHQKINGFELAKQLHAMGYKELYMISGKDFAKEEIPNYLTVILKTDTDKIYKLV